MTTTTTTTTSAGSGGAGGGTTTGTGGASGSGGAGGAAPAGTVLLFAGGGPKMVGGEFHPGSGWTSTVFNEASSDGPAIALTGPSSAVTVIRSTQNGGELRFATWTPGSFSAFATIAAGVTTRATPWLAGSGGRADLVFHGDNFKHYFGEHQAAWAPIAEPVGGVAAQSFGPSPASIALLGSNTVVSYAGQNGDLFDQTRSGGAWQAANPHGLGDVVTLTPALVALSAPGPDLLVVFVRKSDSKILFTTRTGNVWSAPAVTDEGSFSADPVALAALPGGAAVAAFRGLDGEIYFTRFTPGAAPPWSIPGPLATPNFSTPSSPALAPGVGGADAELAFANGSDGLAYHSRLTNMAWSAPVAVGGSMVTRVALTSAP